MQARGEGRTQHRKKKLVFEDVDGKFAEQKTDYHVTESCTAEISARRQVLQHSRDKSHSNAGLPAVNKCDRNRQQEH